MFQADFGGALGSTLVIVFVVTSSILADAGGFFTLTMLPSR